MRGKHHLSETKRKISQALKGKKVSPWKGKELSLEHRRKISLSITGSKNPRWKGGPPKCQNCNKQLSDSRYNTKFCSKCNYHSEERNSKLRGDRHWNWQGGKTPIGEQVRNTWQLKEWRRRVFERDDYTCQLPECGVRSGDGKAIVLNSNHIKRFVDYPELRFDIKNGITLCKPCHLFITGHEKDWEWVFRAIVDGVNVAP